MSLLFMVLVELKLTFEALAVVELCRELQRSLELPRGAIGVITFYKAQVDLLFPHFGN